MNKSRITYDQWSKGKNRTFAEDIGNLMKEVFNETKYMFYHQMVKTEMMSYCFAACVQNYSDSKAIPKEFIRDCFEGTLAQFNGIDIPVDSIHGTDTPKVDIVPTIDDLKTSFEEDYPEDLDDTSFDDLDLVNQLMDADGECEDRAADGDNEGEVDNQPDCIRIKIDNHLTIVIERTSETEKC